MYLVMYISHDVEQADAILQEWMRVGVEGATIIESAGLRQMMNSHLRDDLSIMPTLANLLRDTEVHHRTLFSAIRDDTLLQKVVQTTTAYVGDWSKPDVGILLVLPLLQAYGVEKGHPQQKTKARPS
ncbi:MAG: hypothetical protein HY862_04290 [Chloroflexi bacterium]|nr:hypothetical protein [Chloroflexota bacterium]